MIRLILIGVFIIIGILIIPSIVGAATLGVVWKPELNTSWQWMIDHELDINNAKDMGITNPNGVILNYPVPIMYDIDGFDNTVNTVASLHSINKKVTCYISAGTFENWRPDASNFPSFVKGNNNGWAGEKWLDIRRIDILGPIMSNRMQMCVQKGFDALEPDNIDGYTNRTGFNLTYNNQLVYNKWLADTAHSLGLSIALKNDVDQIKDLQPWFDWALNEQAFQYREYSNYSLFTNAGKAVFGVEYKLAKSKFCPIANNKNWNWMKIPLSLDGGRNPCR